MPQFKKNKKTLKMRKRRSSTRHYSAAKTAIKKKPASKIEPVITNKAVSITHENHKIEESIDTKPQALTPTVQTLATSIQNKPPTNTEDRINETQTQIDEIERIIDSASLTLESLTQEEKLEPQVTTYPEKFDGVSDTDEHIELLEMELKNSHKQARKLAHEIELLKAEFETEKKELKENVQKLRKEMHRTAPIEDNKFFTLSRDLRDAIQALSEIANGTEVRVDVDLSNVDMEEQSEELEKQHKVVVKAPEEAADNTVSRTVVKNTQPIVQKADTSDQEKKSKETTAPSTDTTKKPMKKKKKLLITGGVAAALLILMTGLISNQLFGEAEVNQDLVQEYLENGGEVAGTQTEAQQADGVETSQEAVNPAPPVQPENDMSQADVSFTETVWDTYDDGQMGIKLQYPLNAVKLNKTDSNVTFQRKNGFIFKIQKIDTGLDLAEYWKQVEPTNLSHKATETTLKEREAIFLELDEENDYPGDRYLVKMDGYILDVWFATPSNKFDNDDMLRVERMLKTLSFKAEETS